MTQSDREGRSAGLPVTVVLARHPAPGREAELDAWAHGIVESAEAFPGHLGAEVYSPAPPDRDELVIAFSFANADALTTWEHSAERRHWIKAAEPLLTGEATPHTISGFEGIFSHVPGRPVMPAPRWKTAAIIALALYPASLLLNWAVVPHLLSWNICLRVLVTTAIIVPFMSWVGVPYLSRWLRGWLQPAP
jgi:antibiotic biosynthesis monooxygenase (ABM) superfamily enzyme